MERGDFLNILSRLFLALFLIAASLSQVSPAAAQATAQAEGALHVSTPETGLFPTIQFRLDAYDAGGNFIDSLKTGDVQIIEDGQAIQPQAIEKIQSGLQVIVALSLDPAMAKKQKDITGYQMIQNALMDWARSRQAAGSAQGASLGDSQAATQAPAQTANDDFSLSAPTGLLLTRESNPDLIVKALSDYQPDLAHAQPALGSLAQALDLATDPLEKPSMKRAILYITPVLPASNNATIADLTKRAEGVGVRINVWQLMQPSGNPNTNPANPFQQMAAATGGQFQVINFANPVPEVEPLFQPLRSTYQVRYISAIKKSGEHSLSVQVKQPSAMLVSSESNFNLEVEPPNPIFLSPPASIERSWTSAANDVAASLTPAKVTLQIMVEFPDQHPRALKATRLFVNDKLVAENTSAPFDSFGWPIADITTPAKEMLRVEVVDVLDLSGSSIELPIEVMIDQPAKAGGSAQISISTRGMVAVGAVAAAGLALMLVLILTGNRRRVRRKRQQVDKRLSKDPVTQPVLIQQESDRKHPGQSQRQSPAEKPAGTKPAGARPVSSWMNPIWPRSGAQNAPARLVALDENEQPITGGAILLTRQEITFGTDPQRATQVLESPTVNELHARLYRSPEGNFFLADQGSVAGTWVNYAPVTINGARLEHGDLIHIGRVMFRFELISPTQADIKVIDLEQLP